MASLMIVGSIVAYLIMVGWASLPPDLVRRVGKLLLATDDIDCYFDKGAVCRGWRSAIAKPSGVADLRFRPRNWVMLDEASRDDVRLFVNVSTGCFRCRRLPWLRDHFLVTTSDGLLVLGDRKRLSFRTARVLNPFTGSSVRFAVPFPNGISGLDFAAVGGCSEPKLVFFLEDSEEYGDMINWADPTSEDFWEESHPAIGSESVVAYAGDVYVAYSDGAVFRGVGRVRHWYAEPIIEADTCPEADRAWMSASRCCLVESAGELLLVRCISGAAEVFKVDVDRKALERVDSIGGRSLFLGDRCLSVDADNLPSVDGGSVYYARGDESIYRYDMKDGSGEEIPGFAARPSSLLQLLLT